VKSPENNETLCAEFVAVFLFDLVALIPYLPSYFFFTRNNLP